MDMRTATIRVHAGPIPVVRFVGLMTEHAVATSSYPLQDECRVLVSDMRQAVLLCPPDAMANHICGHPRYRTFAAALIACEQNAELLRKFAWFCALRGVLRVVFLDPAEAMAWAVKQQAFAGYLAQQEGGPGSPELLAPPPDALPASADRA
jgi:hypothetical protein